MDTICQKDSTGFSLDALRGPEEPKSMKGTRVKEYRGDAVVIGGGLAGLAATYELLEGGKKVILIDRDSRENLGGLARRSFGGVCLIGTPHQKKNGIQDSPELAREDWLRYGEMGTDERWPRAWIDLYVQNSIPMIYRWLDDFGVKFVPLVNWPERGMHIKGNSVPRWHITWGTGYVLSEAVVAAVLGHRNAKNLTIHFDHKVDALIPAGKTENGMPGCSGIHEPTKERFKASGESVILAAGGIGGGDLSFLRHHWRRAPKRLLNGAHIFADGVIHTAAAKLGARMTHLDRHWHYAAGISADDPIIPHYGLSLVPPRSALWVNARGRRIGPPPLMGYTDTLFLVESILKEPGGFSWQILNRRIAWKELAVSGSEHMTAFRDRNRFKLLTQLLFGNRELLERLRRESDDIIVADSIEDLCERMNALETDFRIDVSVLREEIRRFDGEMDNGDGGIRDEQLQRIRTHRASRVDRMRTCWLQKINDPGARPLIAIREQILSRKSLGGIQTDTHSRVLNKRGKPIPGFFAAGEAAGFGGGGIHGIRSLEGTFLGGCVLTGRVAGRAAAGKEHE